MTAEIRTGRWQDTLPGTYDPSRTVVITDPPYGLGVAGGKGYTDTIPWAQHVREVLELPAVRHVIRGPAASIIRREHPEPRRVCVEYAAFHRRAMNRPGTVPYLWQGWAVYGRLRVERHARQPMGDVRGIHPYATGPVTPGRTGHRGMTPYEAAVWIIDTWTDPGMLVLDPFAGTGTIGLAAAALGFDYLGAEIVEQYAKVARELVAIDAPTLELA